MERAGEAEVTSSLVFLLQCTLVLLVLLIHLVVSPSCGGGGSLLVVAAYRYLGEPHTGSSPPQLRLSNNLQRHCHNTLPSRSPNMGTALKTWGEYYSHYSGIILRNIRYPTTFTS